MRRRASSLFGTAARSGVAAVAALVLVAPAAAVESTIRPGVGMGKIKIGMTPPQVKRLLGPGFLVNARDAGYVEFGWNFSSWAVGFKANHVVLVSTTLHSQRTTSGIGPGSKWPRLVRAYPHGLCTFEQAGGLYELEYLVPHKGGTQTVYRLQSRYNRHLARITDYHVIEVRVRTPYERLPEFAPGWRDQCAPDWRTAAIPSLRQR
jgi:hypothetical protein